MEIKTENFDLKKAEEYFMPFVQLKNYNAHDYPLLHYGFKFGYYTLFIKKYKDGYSLNGVGFNEKIIQTTSKFNIYYIGTFTDCVIKFKTFIQKRFNDQKKLEYQNELFKSV